MNNIRQNFEQIVKTIESASETKDPKEVANAFYVVLGLVDKIKNDENKTKEDVESCMQLLAMMADNLGVDLGEDDK